MLALAFSSKLHSAQVQPHRAAMHCCRLPVLLMFLSWATPQIPHVWFYNSLMHFGFFKPVQSSLDTEKHEGKSISQAVSQTVSQSVGQCVYDLILCPPLSEPGPRWHEAAATRAKARLSDWQQLSARGSLSSSSHSNSKDNKSHAASRQPRGADHTHTIHKLICEHPKFLVSGKTVFL